MHLPEWARRWSLRVRDFIYPPACLWCRNPTQDVRNASSRFCLNCQGLLAPVIKDRCERCSAPVGPHLNTAQGCIHCRTDPFSFSRAISIGPYEKELRKACLLCKQPGHAVLARGLTEVLCQQNAAVLTGWNVDVVVPVPHYWLDRLRQADHAADAVADQLGRFLMVPVERHILSKVRWTRKQLQLSASARRENLRSAFRVAGHVRLNGVRVLLADDILTTGTTAHRAARPLLEAGAQNVSVAVLARGIGA